MADEAVVEEQVVEKVQEVSEDIWEEMSSEIDALADAGETTGSQQPVEETAEGEVTEEAQVDTPEDAPVLDAVEEPDEFLDELPEDSPSPDNWKNMREQYKKIKQELKQTKQSEPAPDVDLSVFGLPTQAEQPQADPSGLVQDANTAIAATQQPDPAQEVKPEFVFEHLAKMEVGEADRDLMVACEQAVGTMSPQAVVAVIDRAKQNGFGENSDTVLNMARLRLPEVQATWEARSQRQDSASDWNEQRTEAMKQVAQLDGMDDKGSETYKSFITGAQELYHALPNLQWQADAPSVIQRYSELLQKEKVAGSVVALQKENEQLKKQINQGTSTLSTGQKSTISSGKSGDIWTDMARELDLAGVPD